MFLSGAQLCGILAGSEHLLFVDGPDLHAEVTPPEMQALAQTAAMMGQMQQQAEGGNARLESALAMLHQSDITENRSAVVSGFLEEFCRVPIAGEVDEDADCIVLSTGAAENTPENAPRAGAAHPGQCPALLHVRSRHESMGHRRAQRSCAAGNDYCPIVRSGRSHANPCQQRQRRTAPAKDRRRPPRCCLNRTGSAGIRARENPHFCE